MTTFNLVAGICGIVAFVVLCLQGLRLLRHEKQVWFTRDPARSLAQAKGACKQRHLAYTELEGTVAGIEVRGPVYKVRAARQQGERENWLSPLGVSTTEFR